MDKNKE